MKYNGFEQCLHDMERRIIELESESVDSSCIINSSESVDSKSVVTLNVETCLQNLISDYKDSDMLAPIAYECLHFIGLSDTEVDKYLQMFGIEEI